MKHTYVQVYGIAANVNAFKSHDAADGASYVPDLKVIQKVNIETLRTTYFTEDVLPPIASTRNHLRVVPPTCGGWSTQW